MATQRRRKPLSTMAILTLIILAILAAGAIGLFAYQTWEFVNWLFPVENLLMKILAVVNFDIFSYVWLMVGLFLAPLLHPTSKSLAFIVGIVTFILSLACSVIQMMLAQSERFLTAIDPKIIYFAYALVILALVINIVTVLTLLHIQWPYISGEKSLDDLLHKRNPGFEEPTPEEERTRTAIISQMQQPTRSELAQASTNVLDEDEIERRVMSRVNDMLTRERERNTSPLPPAPTANQNGNGHKGQI